MRLFPPLVFSVAVLLTTVGQAFADGSEFTKFEIVVGGLLESEGGQWNAKESPLLRPFGVDFNTAGKMFIVELEGGRVFEFADRQLRHVSGDGSKSYAGDGKSFSKATFNGMHNCAVTPQGDLYIADSWNHCIRKADAATGKISTVVGSGKAGFSGDNGPASQAAFDFIMCITLNHDSSVLHVADLKNRRIRAVDLKTNTVSTVAGNGEKGKPTDGTKAIAAPLVDPRAVAADSKRNVYILERGGHALRVVRTDGTIHTVAGTGQRGFNDGPALQAQFASPKHICVDDADNVYIADDQNKAIRRYSPATGQVSTVLGRGFGQKNIQLKNPHGVCWENGQLFVVDTSHNRILRLYD